jgi:hypothetical protein
MWRPLKTALVYTVFVSLVLWPMAKRNGHPVAIAAVTNLPQVSVHVAMSTWNDTKWTVCWDVHYTQWANMCNSTRSVDQGNKAFAGLLRRDGVSQVERFPTFRSSVQPSFLRSSASDVWERRQYVLSNVTNLSPSATASHPTTSESSAFPIISHSTPKTWPNQ